MSATDAPKMNLENHIVPVTDVDRAKGFYARLGWRLDDDVAPMEGLRFVQFTPPGSAASITFGLGLNTAAPGSTQGTLVVSDILAAHDGLRKLGIDVSDIWHGPPFPVEARQPGPDPARALAGAPIERTDHVGEAEQPRHPHRDHQADEHQQRGSTLVLGLRHAGDHQRAANRADAGTA